MKMERRGFLKFVGASCFGALNALAGKRLAKATTPVPIPPFSPSAKVGEAVYPRFDPRCPFVFRSDMCGYKGQGSLCFKTFEECKLHGNSQNFGAFPPVELYDIELPDGGHCYYTADHAIQEGDALVFVSEGQVRRFAGADISA